MLTCRSHLACKVFLSLLQFSKQRKLIEYIYMPVPILYFPFI